MKQCFCVDFRQIPAEKDRDQYERDREPEPYRKKRTHGPHCDLAEQKRACSQRESKPNEEFPLPFVHVQSFFPVHSVSLFCGSDYIPRSVLQIFVALSDHDYASVLNDDVHSVLNVLEEFVP